MRKVRLKKQKKKPDSYLVVLTFLLTLLGIIAVADVSAPQALSTFSDKFYFVKQQAVWGFLGIVAMIVASRIHYTLWEKVAVPFFVASIALLILVLIPSIGTQALGARRWIILGNLSLQPSEIIKLSLAIYFAKLATKQKKAWAYFLPLGLVAALIMAQPDFGTTVMVGVIGLAQVFISGVSTLALFGGVSLATLVGIAAIYFSDYRRQRLLTYLKYTQDPLGSAYHIRQVLLALGLGGLFGVGLGQSRQKYLFLPETATDSIFAVIAEELGFVGASIILVLFAVFVIRGLKIAQQAPDKFSQVLVTGIVVWIGGQAILNTASMVALVPLTGIPLPFFSYGGSALITALLSVGILLNVSKYAIKTKKRKKKS